MPSPRTLKLENQICHSLYSATNALVRAYRPHLERLNLTYPQYLVMLALWDQDHVIIKELVRKTRFDAGTLTPILKRLEAKNLVKLCVSEADSRQREVIVSETGKALAHKARTTPGDLSCSIDMAPDDALQLKALAEKLYTLISTADSSFDPD